MPATTPDKIFYADGSTLLSIATISATTATSVQTALSKKQKQTFRWEIAGEKASTEGMVIGDIGYNVPDNTEYIYNGSTWLPWNRLREVYTATISNFSLATTATTVLAYYSISSGVCNIDMLATLGTGATTGIGDVTLSLPTGFTMAYHPDFQTYRMILPGSVQMRNAAGTVMFGGAVRMDATTPSNTVNILRNSATAGQLAAVTASLPFVWATGDQLQASFSYNVA